MSKIVRTLNLGLTKYTGIRLPLFFNDYSDDMQKIDDAIGALQTSSEDYGTRITELETDVSDLSNTVTDHGQRLAYVEEVIHTVSTQNIMDLQSRLGALENKVVTNATNIHEINDNIDEVNENILTLGNTLTTTINRVTSVEGRVTTLEDCCVNVRDRLTATEIATQKNADDIGDIQQRLTRDEANIQGNADDIVILSAQVATNAHNIDDITHALDDLDPSSQLEIVRQVAENTTAISQLTELTSVHTQRLDGYATRFTQDELRITDLERRMTIAEDALEQVGDWQTQIDTMQSTIDNLVDVEMPALTTLVNGYDDRITALETWETSIDTFVTQTGTRLTTAESKISALESADVLLDNRVTSAESDIDTIEGRLDIDEGNITGLGTRLTSLEEFVGDDDISVYGDSITDSVLEAFSRIASFDSTKQDKMQYSTMPTASASNAGMIYQYTGVSGSTYINGLFYECKNVGGNYTWVQIPTNGLTFDVMPSDAELFAMPAGTIFFTYGFYDKKDGCGGYYFITTYQPNGTGGLKKVYNGETRYLLAIDDYRPNKGYKVDVCRYGVRNVDSFDWNTITKANTYAQENSDIINNIYCPWNYATQFYFPMGNFFFADPFDPKGGVNNNWFGACIKGTSNPMDNRSASATKLIFPFLSNGDFAIKDAKYGSFEDIVIMGNPNQYNFSIDREQTYVNPSGIVTETIAEEGGEQIKVGGAYIHGVGIVRNVSIRYFYTGIKTVGNRYFTDVYFENCHNAFEIMSDVKAKGIYGWNCYNLIDCHDAGIPSIEQARVDSCVHVINFSGNCTDGTFIDIDGDYCTESVINASGWTIKGCKFIGVGGRCCCAKAYDSTQDTPPDITQMADTSGYGVVRYSGGGVFSGNYFNLKNLAVGNPTDDGSSTLKIPTNIAFTFGNQNATIMDNVFEVTSVDDINALPKQFQIKNTNFGIKVNTGWDDFVVYNGGIKGMFTELITVENNLSAIIPSTASSSNKLVTQRDLQITSGILQAVSGVSSIQSSGYARWFKFGRICFIEVNLLDVVQSTPDTVFLTGAPLPLIGAHGGQLPYLNGTQVLPLAVQLNGDIISQGGVINSGTLHGSFCYITLQ